MWKNRGYIKHQENLIHKAINSLRLYLINPSNPLVSLINVKESRWNRYRVWKPLSLMILAGLTPPDWDITIVDENRGALLKTTDQEAFKLTRGLGARNHAAAGITAVTRTTAVTVIESTGNVMVSGETRRFWRWRRSGWAGRINVIHNVLGIGLRSLSVAVSLVPDVKNAIRNLDSKDLIVRTNERSQI